MTNEHEKIYFIFRTTEETEFEPQHDKTNKMSVRPAKIHISLGIRLVWSEPSLSAWRTIGSLATHSAHSEDWSDWADAQADLGLRWVHMPHCWFCHAPAHLELYTCIM